MFPVIALIWIIGSGYLIQCVLRLKRHSTLAFLTVTLASTTFCILWHWQEWQVFTDSGIYPGDSLHTLGPIKATALASLTSLLMVCLAYLSWTTTETVVRRISLTRSIALIGALLNGVIAMIFYWLVLSIVPQFYYFIYLQIFPDLPLQLVVQRLIPVETFLSLLLFREQPTLSNHAAGLLGWVLFVNAVVQWLSTRPAKASVHKNA